MRYFIFVMTLFLILSGCAIKEVIDLSKDSKDIKQPTWDMKFEVPIIEMTKSMNDYFTVPSIIEASIDMPEFQSIWPLPANTSANNLPSIPPVIESQTVEPQVVSTPVCVDIDGDGSSDFTMTELVSENGYMQIIISMEKDGVSVPMVPGDISLTGIEIEGKLFSFSEPESAESDGSLKFITKDFLAGSNPSIRPDTTGDADKIDMRLDPDCVLFNTHSNTSPLDGIDFGDPVQLAAFIANPPEVNGYKFNFSVSFSFGTGFSIIGKINEERSLYSLKGQEIPLTESQSIIQSFTLKMETANHLPVGIQLKNGLFYNSQDLTVDLIDNMGTDATDDDTTDINISLGDKTTYLTTSSSIFDKGAMSMNMDVVIPANSDIVISGDMYITFKLSISGSGKIDLQYF